MPEKNREAEAKKKATITEAKTFKEEIERGDPTKDNTVCLFCPHKSETFEDNLKHMSMKHGFFILEEKNCINLKGLFKYLAEKIYVDKLCIFYDYEKCGKFKTAQAVQNHMCDVGHCRMNQDLFDEYDKFYDFKEENERIAKRLEEKYKTMKGGQEFVYTADDKKDKGHVGEAYAFPGNQLSEEDSSEEWESDDSEGEEWADCDSNGEEIVEEKAEKPKKKVKLTNEQKRFVLRHARMLDTDELMLPSGKIAGHRKYKTYYTQRPHIRTEEGNMRYLQSGRKVYGGRCTYETGVMLKKQMNSGEIMLNDYHRYLALERKKVDKNLKHVYRKKDHMFMRLGVAGNLTLRHYFRDRNIVFG